MEGYYCVSVSDMRLLGYQNKSPIKDYGNFKGVLHLTHISQT